MNKPSKKWLAKHAERVLKEIGVKENQQVLDFGCGKGVYTIPAAKIVGESGVVYAVDKSKGVLKKLGKKRRLNGLTNIRITDTLEEVENESIDLVLLYDVLHHIDDKKILLEEIYRISKSNALISVYPHIHLDANEIKEEMAKANFYLKNTYKNCILNFRKR